MGADPFIKNMKQNMIVGLMLCLFMISVQSYAAVQSGVLDAAALASQPTTMTRRDFIQKATLLSFGGMLFGPFISGRKMTMEEKARAFWGKKLAELQALNRKVLTGEKTFRDLYTMTVASIDKPVYFGDPSLKIKPSDALYNYRVKERDQYQRAVARFVVRFVLDHALVSTSEEHTQRLVDKIVGEMKFERADQTKTVSPTAFMQGRTGPNFQDHCIAKIEHKEFGRPYISVSENMFIRSALALLSYTYAEPLYLQYSMADDMAYLAHEVVHLLGVTLEVSFGNMNDWSDVLMLRSAAYEHFLRDYLVGSEPRRKKMRESPFAMYPGDITSISHSLFIGKRRVRKDQVEQVYPDAFDPWMVLVNMWWDLADEQTYDKGNTSNTEMILEAYERGYALYNWLGRVRENMREDYGGLSDEALWVGHGLMLDYVTRNPYARSSYAERGLSNEVGLNPPSAEVAGRIAARLYDQVLAEALRYAKDRMMITTISSSEFALKVHRAIRGAFKDVVIGLVRDARIHYKTPYKADEKKSVRTVNDWVDELLPAARERLNIEQIAAQAQDGMTDITVVSSYLDRREQPVSEQAGSGPLSTLQSA